MIDIKTQEVSEGCMTFIHALIKQHYAAEIDVYQRLAALCQAEANRLMAIDPSRNK